jgi:hypothetical protein
MNKNFIYGLVVGLVALALFGFKSAIDKPVASVQKWEYKTIGFTSLSKIDERINPLGQEGWELSAVNGGLYTLKRPIQ